MTTYPISIERLKDTANRAADASCAAYAAIGRDADSPLLDEWIRAKAAWELAQEQFETALRDWLFGPFR